MNPTAGQRLSIIVPAFNEAGGIESALRDLRARFPDAEILAVDDGSSDGTADRVKSVTGVRLLRHRHNRGYGASLKTGMRAARGNLLAWFDADAQHSAADLMQMVAQLERDHLTAVIGERRAAHQSYVRYSGKWLVRMLGRSLDIRGTTDLNCGLRVFRRSVILRYLDLLPNGFSASLTSLIVLLERNHPFAFYPVTVKDRVGESKVKIRDGFQSIVQMLRMITLFAPLRIFLRGGFIFIALGVIYGLWVALRNRLGIPVASSLAIVTGVLLCMLGLIADQISQLRLSALDHADTTRDEEADQE